jgi:hypothetical protein
MLFEAVGVGQQCIERIGLCGPGYLQRNSNDGRIRAGKAYLDSKFVRGASGERKDE